MKSYTVKNSLFVVAVMVLLTLIGVCSIAYPTTSPVAGEAVMQNGSGNPSCEHNFASENCTVDTASTICSVCDASVWDGTSVDDSFINIGDLGSEYVIMTAPQFKRMADVLRFGEVDYESNSVLNQVDTSYVQFKLGRDIDLNNKPWDKIDIVWKEGNDENGALKRGDIFLNLDGQGYSVKNMNIDKSGTEDALEAHGVGFIGAATGVFNISSVIFDGCSVKTTLYGSEGLGSAGIIFGDITYAGGVTLTNVTVKNSIVQSPSYAGAFFGRGHGEYNNCLVENCEIIEQLNGTESGYLGGFGGVVDDTVNLIGCGVVGTLLKSNANSNIEIITRVGTFIGSVDSNSEWLFYGISIEIKDCYTDINTATHEVHKYNNPTIEATNIITIKLVGEEWDDWAEWGLPVIPPTEVGTRWCVDKINDGSESNLSLASLDSDHNKVCVRDDVIEGEYAIHFYSNIESLTDVKINNADFSDYTTSENTLTLNIPTDTSVATLSFTVANRISSFNVEVLPGFNFMPGYTLSTEGAELFVYENDEYFVGGLSNDLILTFNEPLAEGATASVLLFGNDTFECVDGATINLGKPVGAGQVDLTYVYDGIEFSYSTYIVSGLQNVGYEGIYMLASVTEYVEGNLVYDEEGNPVYDEDGNLVYDEEGNPVEVTRNWEIIDLDGTSIIGSPTVTKSAWMQNHLYLFDKSKISFKYAASTRNMREDEDVPWEYYMVETFVDYGNPDVNDINGLTWKSGSLELNTESRVNTITLVFSADYSEGEEAHGLCRGFIGYFEEVLPPISVSIGFDERLGTVVLKDPTGTEPDKTLANGEETLVVAGRGYILSITPYEEIDSTLLEGVKTISGLYSYTSDGIKYPIDPLYRKSGAELPVIFAEGSSFSIEFKEEVAITSDPKINYTVNGVSKEKAITTIDEYGTLTLQAVDDNSVTLLAPVVGYENEKATLFINNKEIKETLQVEGGYYYYYIPELKNNVVFYFVYSVDGNTDIAPRIIGNHTIKISIDVEIDKITKSDSIPFEYILDVSPSYGFIASVKASEKDNYAFQNGNEGKKESISYFGINPLQDGCLVFEYLIGSEELNDFVFVFVNERPSIESVKEINDEDARLISGTKSTSSGKQEWQEYSIYVQQGIPVYFGYYKDYAADDNGDIFAVRNVGLYSGSAYLICTTSDGSSGITAYMTANGVVSEVTNQSTNISIGSRIKLVYQNPDYEFMGWRNKITNKIDSVSPTYEFVCTQQIMSYLAVVSPKTGNEFIARDDSNFYKSLKEAFNKDTECVIELFSDYTLTEDITIPSNITLILLHREDSTNGFDVGGEHASDRVSWNSNIDAYKTLTINEGVTLTINGKLVVGGVQHKPNQSAQAHTSGVYSQIVNNGSIVVANGGYLDVIGRVMSTTDNGTITVNDGATLRTPFMINNYAGGTNTEGHYKNNHFPFVQFDVVNIECKQIVHYGAKVVGASSLYFWSSIHTQDIVLIDKEENRTIEGAEGSLIWLANGSRVEIERNDKRIDQVVGNIHLGDSYVNTISVYGNVRAGEFYLQGYGSAKMVLSVPYTYNFNIKNGAVLTIANAYKIMPGAVVTIEEGATVNVEKGGALHVYGGLIQADKSGKRYPDASILAAHGFNKSGMLVVNGTLNINGTFTGIIDTDGETGTINIASDAVLTATLTEGSTGGYTNDQTIFVQSARIYGIDSYVGLVAGKTYKAFSADTFIDETFSVTSAARVDESQWTITINQTHKGRFLDYVGGKYVSDMKFYIGEKVAGVNVAIDGTQYLTDENGEFVARIALNGMGDSITYNSRYTKPYTHTINAVGTQTLMNVAKSVELDDANSYVRIMDKEGNVAEAFVLKATVAFYGAGENETVRLTFDETALNGIVYVAKNVALTNEHITVSLKSNLSVATQSVAQYVYDVENLASQTDVVASAIALYSTHNALIAAATTSEDIQFINECLQGKDAFAGEIVKELHANATPTYGDTTVAVTLTKVNGTTEVSQGALSDWNWNESQASVIVAVTYDGTCGTKAYSVSNTCSALRKNVTVTVTKQTSVYGDPIKDIEYTADGIVGNDDLKITLTKANGVNKGEYAVSGAYNHKLYTVEFKGEFTYEITARPVTVTIADKSVVYGESAGLTYNSVENVVDGDNLGITLTRVSGNDVGEYAITGTASNGNYAVTFVNGKYEITARPVTVTIADKSVVYGESELALTSSVTAGNVVGDDDLGITLTRKEGNDVGEYAITGEARNTNYKVTFKDGKYTITKFQANIVIAKPHNLMEGSESVSITATVAGEPDSNYHDTLTYGLYNGATLVATVANNVITVSEGQTLSVGEYRIVALNHNDNYEIASQNEVTLVIVAMNNYYKVTFGDSEKTYDGIAYSVAPEVVIRETNAPVTGFTVAYKLGVEGVEEIKSAGNYTIVLTITADGSEFTHAFKVNQREVTVTIADKSVVYGESELALTSSVTAGNVVVGDNLGITLTRVLGNDVGEYAITGTASNGNYAVTFVNGKYEITARPVTVTIADKSVVYGESELALTSSVTAGNVVGDDDLGITLTRKEGNDVGEYAITGEARNTNYKVTFKDGKYTITARPVTVTIDSKEATYGESELALASSVTAGNVVGEDDLGITLTRASGNNVGEYAITGTASNANYKVTFNDGKYEITAREVTVVIERKQAVYGDDATVLSAKLMEGSTLGYYDDYATLKVKLSIDGEAKNVGKYDVKATSENANYNVVFEGCKEAYEITARKVTVVIDSKEVTYGERELALTSSVTAGNVVGEDDLGITLTRVSGNDVGEYAITGTASNTNYVVTFSTATYTITAREITIRIEDATSVYGDADSAFTVSVVKGDMVNDGNPFDLVSISRTEGTNAGNYDITAELKGNLNYKVELAYTTATKSVYTITKRPITVTVDSFTTDSSKTYAEVVALFGYKVTEGAIMEGDEIVATYTLLINGEIEANAENYSGTITGGKHTLTAVFENDKFQNDNYEFTVENGVMTVTKPQISVVGITSEFTYDDGNAIPAFDMQKNIVGLLKSAQPTAVKATYVRKGSNVELNEITEAGEYDMTIIIVHTNQYEFVEGATTEYTITVNKKNIDEDMTVEGATDNGWLAQGRGLGVYAVLNKYADKDIFMEETLTLDGEDVDSVYEVGTYAYSATIDDSNYEGSIAVTFRVIPNVYQKMASLKAMVDEYPEQGTSSAKFKLIVAMRGVATTLTADDLQQIESDDEYTATLEAYKSLYNAFMQEMAQDVTTAQKASSRRLAIALSASTALAVLFWFGIGKH